MNHQLHKWVWESCTGTEREGKTAFHAKRLPVNVFMDSIY